MALLLLIIVWGGLVPAPASSQETRVNTLELEIRSIESRLNRIESQLSRFGGGSPRVPTTPPTSNNTGRYRQGLSGDPMFDRLATLAIELRERIDRLDTRVSKLEKGTPRANR